MWPKRAALLLPCSSPLCHLSGSCAGQQQGQHTTVSPAHAADGCIKVFTGGGTLHTRVVIQSGPPTCCKQRQYLRTCRELVRQPLHHAAAVPVPQVCCVHPLTLYAMQLQLLIIHSPCTHRVAICYTPRACPRIALLGWQVKAAGSMRLHGVHTCSIVNMNVDAKKSTDSGTALRQALPNTRRRGLTSSCPQTPTGPAPEACCSD